MWMIFNLGDLWKLWKLRKLWKLWEIWKLSLTGRPPASVWEEASPDAVHALARETGVANVKIRMFCLQSLKPLWPWEAAATAALLAIGAANVSKRRRRARGSHVRLLRRASWSDQSWIQKMVTMSWWPICQLKVSYLLCSLARFLCCLLLEQFQIKNF